MLISTGAAARVLAEAGVARTQAQVLLSAGLAGRGVPTAGAVLYDERSVRALADRPLVEPDELAAACPHGLFIARIDRSRDVDATTGWAERAHQLSVQPPMPPLTRALLAARIAAYGALPWVATLCGRVVLGADAVGTALAPDRSIAFTLVPPSVWFETVADRVLPSGRGGRSWVVWTPR